MKLQKSPKPKRTLRKYCVLRGRVPLDLKERVEKFGRQIERSEAYIIRQAVDEYLRRSEKAA